MWNLSLSLSWKSLTMFRLDHNMWNSWDTYLYLQCYKEFPDPVFWCWVLIFWADSESLDKFHIFCQEKKKQKWNTSHWNMCWLCSCKYCMYKKTFQGPTDWSPSPVFWMRDWNENSTQLKFISAFISVSPKEIIWPCALSRTSCCLQTLTSL